jgi:hypothetical protein
MLIGWDLSELIQIGLDSLSDLSFASRFLLFQWAFAVLLIAIVEEHSFQLFWLLLY